MRQYIVVYFFLRVLALGSNVSGYDEDSILHQVSIQLYNIHHCAGSILDEMTVLSAAHCFYRHALSSLTVVVGTDLVDPRVGFHKIFAVKSHEHFKPKTLENDIAVIKLISPMFFNSIVQPIGLDRNFVANGVKCAMSGWGFGVLGFARSITQHIELISISNERCQRLFKQTLNYTQLCAFGDRQQNSCIGDSGAPLIANNKQIGIVSWKQACAGGFPDVFTRISSFADWIEFHRQ